MRSRIVACLAVFATLFPVAGLLARTALAVPVRGGAAADTSLESLIGPPSSRFT